MKRFLNAAVALAITLVMYQVYVLAVVPIVEPTLPTRKATAATEADWEGGGAAVRRYQKMLANYLPADHWALAGTPQVYEYGPLVLVLDDFRPIDGGRVEITKSVLVAFPTPRSPNAPPPRDAIVVDAPDRARIQFDTSNNADGGDGKLDFASGQIGRPIAGEFPGELVIRSDMREVGPADDLRIVTRNLRFNQSMVTTNAEVDLRLGPHRGTGKVLEIRLLRDPHAGSEMPIAGIESLEIREQVRARIDTGSLNQKDQRVVQRSAYSPRGGVRLVAAESPLAGDGPLELTAGGSFRFDFTKFVASFEDDVRATLKRATGPADELFCRELRLHFGDKQGDATTINPADEPELARRQGSVLSQLEPRLIEAVGNPVRLESPSRQAAVRGRRLRGWIGERRLRIEGAPASLVQGLSEAHAPLLEYQSPAKDSGLIVGDFLAAGPGWMRLTPSADEPDRSYEARWKALPSGEPSVTLRRDARGQPLLSMVGRPEFAAAGLGKLRADRVVTQIREVPADGKDGPAIELGSSKPGEVGAILVNRIDALGSVEFLGQQVDGRADSLVAMVRPVAATNEPAGRGPALGSAVGFRPSSNEPVDDGRRFRLRTKAIQIDVGLAGRRATPLAVVCDGGVRLEEEPDGSGEQPLLVIGDQLRVDRLDRRSGARLTIAGGDEREATEENPHVGLAEIQTQGMRVWVRDLHVDQAAGRAWTEGRGDAHVQLPASDATNPLRGDATLRWRGGMQFDGSRLVLSKEVFAETTGGWLNCAQMEARLSRPIDLRGGSLGGSGGETVDIEEVACSGGVTIDYRSSDDVGQRSHERAKLASLNINRTTGAISGRGPGSIRSVRLASSGGPLSKSTGNDGGAGLKFLRVDFQQGLVGNFQSRAVRFGGRVQTVYGPVLAWDHQLPLHSPEGVPPDAVELRCERLEVNEDPAASVRRGSSINGAFGPIELRALQSVRIDASMGESGGGMVAEAAAATYSQAADRFVLEGDGQQLAKLWVRADASQAYTPATAGRITHYLSRNQTLVDDLRGVEYQSGANAPRPTPSRR